MTYTFRANYLNYIKLYILSIAYQKINVIKVIEGQIWNQSMCRYSLYRPTSRELKDITVWLNVWACESLFFSSISSEVDLLPWTFCVSKACEEHDINISTQ